MADILKAMLDMPGRCRECGTTEYTRWQLNLAEGQDWRCYRCWDLALHPGYGFIPPSNPYTRMLEYGLPVHPMCRSFLDPSRHQ